MLGMTSRGIIKPSDAEELRQVVEWALNDGKTLDVRGSGSKIALGRPMACDQVLDLSGISGIVDYAPEELVVTLRAGTPMRDVEALLAQRNQMLAFEPPDLGPLLGQEAGQGTLVGAVMGNLAGSRRLSAGAARDHLLGFSGVNGRGEIFKSGGKVMKNVTGYDLSKLLAGSWGTLAVLDQVSVKVLPAPDQTRTLILLGLADEAAVKSMCAALGSPHEVSGAAHLPGRTALRIEGVAPSVEARLKALRELLAETGARMEELGTLESRGFWREVRDVAPLKAAADAVVWKISCPPTEGPAIVARIKAQRPAAEAFYDWSGGLVWLALPACADADHAIVRGAIGAKGGHATLIRAPEAVRAAVQVFQPQPAALAALASRVKESFDPKRLFNPGRMA
jgi:glycolate oxidase FAD binding subunit